MSQVNNLISAVQWAQLSDDYSAKPIEQSDYECLNEIYGILKRHSKIDRFGVTLLKSDFNLSEDETKVEYTNVKARIQHIKVEKKSILSNVVETNWKLNDGEIRATLSCVQYCANNIHGNHDSFHK